MFGDVPSGQTTDATTRPTDTATDNLNSARFAPGFSDNTYAPAQANTADQHLPALAVDDTPNNPYNFPGTYNPQDIQFAKNSGFSRDEIRTLEEGGPERFNQSMEWLEKRPDMLQSTKQFADQCGYWQSHPDEIFNPMNVPGTYNPEAIQSAKDKGFNSDQIHVLEQWGPNNFNGIMQYLNQNPDKVDAFKGLANTVGYWETHPDLARDPNKTTNDFNQDDVQFAKSKGLNDGQIKVLEEYGADNFNNTMEYLKQHPDKIQDTGNLANAIGFWELNMNMSGAHQ